MKFKIETFLKLLMVTCVSFAIAFACFYYSGIQYNDGDFVNIKNTVTSSGSNELTTSNADVDFKNIKSLNVATNITDIEIRKDIIGKVELIDSSQDSNNLKIIKDGDSLSVMYKINGNHNFYNGKLVIAIPQSVQDVSIKTLSADINLPSELNLKKLEASAISGDINIDNLNAENIGLLTTSGDISYSGITPGLFIKSVSGDVKVTNNKKLDKVSYDIKAVSGDLTLSLPKDMTAAINTKTVNGDVDISSTQQNKTSDSTINLMTVNGDIIVKDY